jgi:hypothetical protein
LPVFFALVETVLLVVGWYAATVAHELGHVAAARLAGVRGCAVRVGAGRVASFRLLGADWTLGWPWGLRGGSVDIPDVPLEAAPWVALAGPFAGLVPALLASAAPAWVSWPLWVMALVQLAWNLVPAVDAGGPTDAFAALVGWLARLEAPFDEVDVVNVTRGVVIARGARRPRSLLGRMKGLLGTAEPVGMVLSPCRGVHMVGMAYPILAAYLDKRGTVLEARVLRPAEAGPRVRGARSVVELPVEEASHVRSGDCLALRRVPDEVSGDGL